MKAKLSIPKQEGELEISDKEAQNFLNLLVPDFVKQLGGILGDQVRYWRFKNACNIANKAKKLIDDSGLKVEKVPLKILSPLLESASLEEDEFLRDKWAKMLANATTSKISIKPVYVEILKELSPLEVKILDVIFNEISKIADYKQRKMVQFGKQKVQQAFGLSEEEIDLIIENLYRLNLLQAPQGHGMTLGTELGSSYGFVLRTTDIFEFTTLGFNFVLACKFGEE